MLVALWNKFPFTLFIKSIIVCWRNTQFLIWTWKKHTVLSQRNYVSFSSHNLTVYSAIFFFWPSKLIWHGGRLYFRMHIYIYIFLIWLMSTEKMSSDDEEYEAENFQCAHIITVICRKWIWIVFENIIIN
jgi:hypothetical protein